MITEFKNLFSPIDVGNITLRNRICSPSHATGFCADGLPTDRLIAYHSLRAKGGAGLIILEGASVHRSSPPPFNILCLYGDEAIPGLRNLAKEIHNHGCKVFAQLIHHGAVGHVGANGVPLLSPSGVRAESTLFHDIPRAMEHEEILEVVHAYANAARIAKSAGLDGVEISAAQGVLIGQFWSPLTNKREDQYGGNLQNRMRFSFEVVNAIRRTVGSDFAVGVRLTMDEMVDGGLNLPQMLEIARLLTDNTQVDYLNVKGSSYFGLLSAAMQVPPMYVPLGCFVYAASALKREIPEIPIIASTRINNPRMAETILENSEADIIGMCRALIADPLLPQKTMEGRLDDIRLCVGCNQGCIDNLRKGKAITCIQNPITGRELEMAEIRPAIHPKKVLVIGGGPAGLEAARIASLRGHTVTLYERTNNLGGQVLTAARAPLRDEFAGIVRYLARQIERQPVTIKKGVEATIDNIKGEHPDVVIVATGAHTNLPSFPNLDMVHIVGTEEVMLGELPLGKRIVVVDDFGDQEGLSVAETLLDKDYEVIFVTRLFYPGMHIGQWTWVLLYQRVLTKGLLPIPMSEIRSGIGRKITIVNILSDMEQNLDDIDTVVITGCREPNSQLFYKLKCIVSEVYCIGDAHSPRYVAEAILEGNKIGRSI